MSGSPRPPSSGIGEIHHNQAFFGYMAHVGSPYRFLVCQTADMSFSGCWKISTLVNMSAQSFMVDALAANNDVTVLYFYCRSTPLRNHMSILRSLLKQVYLRTDRKALVEDFYANHKEDTPCDGDESIIRSYYELFLEIVSTPRTYIVLDGVDECTADGIENLVNAWKFVFTSSRQTFRVQSPDADYSSFDKE